MKIITSITNGINCPVCGAIVDSIGVSHTGNPSGQWECRHCGWIGQR